MTATLLLKIVLEVTYAIRKKPLHFAFNPGKSAADHVLGLDKRKAPAIIGKAIKASGQGVKVSFGLFELDGKILMLTTENSPFSRHRTSEGGGETESEPASCCRQSLNAEGSGCQTTTAPPAPIAC
ncbi:hypothetical protein [Parasedimentitalea psychrophila]|uniref:Uncharacterized protein n=1 Tax=Parasedimentitalea psychrophila TaxID=2997337 RepID=A0A9Y2L5D9_9RHOB|nr:hypothetical protein [Parasedimentitalea psychrophila]WIY27712.1 hypothetical protein QPJ95_23540 [Parasedimentitalea psychrophila]